MTDQQRQRLNDAINTWATPILLAVVGVVVTGTWYEVREMAAALPTMQYRITALEHRDADKEARLRYVERASPAREQWPAAKGVP